MGICHLIVVTSLVIAANVDQDCLNYNPWDFSGPGSKSTTTVTSTGSQRSGLVDNLPLLNGLYIGILAAMAVNAVLFYLQWWKPAQEEEKEMENEVEQETAMTDSDQQRLEEGNCSIISL